MSFADNKLTLTFTRPLSPGNGLPSLDTSASGGDGTVVVGGSAVAGVIWAIGTKPALAGTTAIGAHGRSSGERGAATVDLTTGAATDEGADADSWRDRHAGTWQSVFVYVLEERRRQSTVLNARHVSCSLTCIFAHPSAVAMGVAWGVLLPLGAVLARVTAGSKGATVVWMHVTVQFGGIAACGYGLWTVSARACARCLHDSVRERGAWDKAERVRERKERDGVTHLRHRRCTR